MAICLWDGLLTADTVRSECGNMKSDRTCESGFLTANHDWIHGFSCGSGFGFRCIQPCE